MPQPRPYARRPNQFTLNTGHPLANGLVFAGLGGPSGVGSSTFYDLSTQRNHGTLTNMDSATDWVWVKQLGRWALDFDGSNDEVTRAAVIPTNMNFTVAFWVKNLGANTVKGCFMMSIAGSVRQLAVYFDANGNNLRADGFTSAKSQKAAASLTTTVWNHICVTWESATTTEVLYINGVAAGTTMNGGTMPPWAASNLSFGRGYNSSSSANCQMADVLISKRILSPGEIARLADPSNVMYDGLLVGPRRRAFKAAVAPPAGHPYYYQMLNRNRRGAIA